MRLCCLGLAKTAAEALRGDRRLFLPHLLDVASRLASKDAKPKKVSTL